MAMSNNVIGAINFVAVILSIPIIGVGIWLLNGQADSCVRFLQWPVIILGVRSRSCLGGFHRRLLENLMAPHYVPRSHACPRDIFASVAYLEYRMDDFSGYLCRRVRSSFKWDRIRSCLSQTNMCAELNQSYRMAQDFFNARLTPMQSGCCKPPTQCAYTFVNPTYWISPINTAADMDCLQWSNDQTQLCYNCDSCKAGLLANLRKEWRRANVILIITVIGLIIVYLIGCCAFRNAKTEDLFRRYEQGYT
ncbi:hypothetical protein Fmac_006409 [Flemingia macrophylla]|uniref:Uncharacterized protein n=1 Tax=Flemingia macrophylla TaxID=520843 RepID=A0ABD1NAI4_9FABA